MHMSGESLLIILLVGLVAGWLAGQIVQGTGFGILGDVLMGITGAFIGSWLVPQLGLHLGTRDHTAPNGPRGPARDDDVLMGRR